MDLRSGKPFWAVQDGLLSVYPPLAHDLSCDVVVAGAGITGALIAHALAESGLEVVMLDARDAASGSTAASTALLQYEIDTPMQELARIYDEATAVQAYAACLDAVEKLHDLTAQFSGDARVRKNGSLYYASHWWHRARLVDECALRRRHGFNVKLIESAHILQRFGLHASCALWSPDAGSVNPHRLTHVLLQRLQRRGVKIFDRSAITGWKPCARGVDVQTDRKCALRCRHLVIAAGFETQKFLRQRVAANRSSYALATEPVNGLPAGLLKAVVWETAHPYLYFRSTPDRRLIIGGEDDSIDIPLKRDAQVERKAKILLKRAQRMFPELDLETAFAWAGTFAETSDGLGYFGAHPEHGPRVQLAMAYGGNGITFSLIGSEIIRDAILRKTNANARLFGFTRTRR